ncbi:hypothetical protein D3C71_1863200 [compost metagenome]
MQYRIDDHFVLGPVSDQLDACLHILWQARQQCLAQLILRHDCRATHGQYRSQLGQQVDFDFRQAQHVFARQDGVAVALAGRACQYAGDTALRLRGELHAQGAQVAELVAVGPGLQGG